MADITTSPEARQLLREALEAAGTAAQRWVDFIDLVHGDPDFEPDDEPEHDGDDLGDPAWTERMDQTKSTSTNRVPWHGGNLEDAEEDDAPEEADHSGDYASEEDPTGYSQTNWSQGPGCPISDPGGTSGCDC